MLWKIASSASRLFLGASGETDPLQCLVEESCFLQVRYTIQQNSGCHRFSQGAWPAQTSSKQTPWQITRWQDPCQANLIWRGGVQSCVAICHFFPIPLGPCRHRQHCSKSRRPCDGMETSFLPSKSIDLWVLLCNGEIILLGQENVFRKRGTGDQLHPCVFVGQDPTFWFPAWPIFYPSCWT